MSVTSHLTRRLVLGATLSLSVLASTSAVQAQWGYGPGVGGYGYGWGGGAPGFGPGLGLGAIGPGGGPVLGGSYGFGAVGYPYGAYVSYAGVPFPASINAYNLGYGNTLGIGLVPPAYVGTGTAGIGPVGIGGTNPLFGLGLSPLAVTNAAAEQALRRSTQSRLAAPTSTARVTHYRFATSNLLADPPTPTVGPSPALPSTTTIPR